MRRLPAVVAISIVLWGGVRAQASLTTVTVEPGDYVQMSLGSHYYVISGETGGEFAMTVLDSSGKLKGTFYTFCADPTTSMELGVLYRVNTVANSNALGYTLSDYGKWIYYEYAKNDSLPTTASFIPGHQSPDFTTLVAGAIQEGIWQELTKKDEYGNVVVDWPVVGWNHDAYNTVAGQQGWVSHYTNNDDTTFAGHKSAIGIAQLQVTGVNAPNQDVQNQMVLTVVTGVGPGVATPEPAAIIVWSLLGAVGWLGVRVWRRSGA
jgi:hypothetical protein